MRTGMNQTLSSVLSSLQPNTSPKGTPLSSLYIPIEGCGSSIEAVDERIRQTRNEALKGFSDAVFGLQSPYGFKSMFKEESARDTVGAIYDAIYYLEARLGLKPNTREAKMPRFACAAENSARVYKSLNLGYDPWQRCRTGSPRNDPITAFYAEDTAYIFLCPAFFAQEEKPDVDHCPVVHDNRFAGDPKVFYKKYQVYTLLYQMIRFYLGKNALNDNSDPREQLDWNNCVRLDTLNSVRNPTNLQIYVALVGQSCTEAPDPDESNHHPYLSSTNSTGTDAVPAESSSYYPWPLKFTATAPGQVATMTSATQLTSTPTLESQGGGQDSGIADA